MRSRSLPQLAGEVVELNALRLGSKSAIEIMVCRSWDVTNTFGKYRGTKFIFDAKVRACYNFQQITAYLAVNYFDPFLCSHRQSISKSKQPKIVAKLEELLVSSLPDLQVEDAKFMFQPKTSHRMELLVF